MLPNILKHKITVLCIILLASLYLSSGELKWRFKTNGIITSSPAIGSDDTLYASSFDYYIYAITSTGKICKEW